MNTHRLRTLLVAMVVSALLGIGLAQPASAGVTYVWNNSGKNVFVTQSPGANRGTLVRNGTAIWMECWTDANWTYGNAWTNRYFRATFYTTAGQIRAYVNATFVFNQTNVRHC